MEVLKSAMFKTQKFSQGNSVLPCVSLYRKDRVGHGDKEVAVTKTNCDPCLPHLQRELIFMDMSCKHKVTGLGKQIGMLTP